MDPLVHIKNWMIRCIDESSTSTGDCYSALEQIEHYLPLFIEHNYAYKGVELCNRMLFYGGWSAKFRQKIVDLRTKFEEAQSRQIWGG